MLAFVQPQVATPPGNDSGWPSSNLKWRHRRAGTRRSSDGPRRVPAHRPVEDEVAPRRAREVTPTGRGLPRVGSATAAATLDCGAIAREPPRPTRRLWIEEPSSAAR